MASSEAYDYGTMMRKVRREGGLMAYFGTRDARELEEKIAQGDEKAHEFKRENQEK